MMFPLRCCMANFKDTIFALIFGALPSGVWSCDLAGAGLCMLLRNWFPEGFHRHARRHTETIRTRNNEVIDHGLVLTFPSPASFTVKIVWNFNCMAVGRWSRIITGCLRLTMFVMRKRVNSRAEPLKTARRIGRDGRSGRSHFRRDRNAASSGHGAELRRPFRAL